MHWNFHHNFATVHIQSLNKTCYFEMTQPPVSNGIEKLSTEPKKAICSYPSANERFVSELSKLDARNLKRELASNSGVDFTSNDFLALGSEPVIVEAVREHLESELTIGAGASRLLRGNHPAHEVLELAASKFFNCEKSLFMANGYIANYGLFTTLPKRGDIIVFDSLMHASARDGIFASLAKGVKFPHNDADAIDSILRRWRQKNVKSFPWIAVESLYSMDGDRAPLDDLFEIADRYGAMLVVDEAHATGVWGENGRGFTEPYEGRENLVSLHTCGKALGVAGALVCASGELIDYMITRCRPFIYSTAPPPMIAVAISKSLEILESEPERRRCLRNLIQLANSELTNKLKMQGSDSQIIPVIIGDDRLALDVACKMQQAGYDLRAIRPPTVPQGTARLRVSITLNVSESEVVAMFGKLQQCLK